MKTRGNEPIVKIQRWKEGEWSIATNHRDNGIQPEGEEGRRYEADFTIVKELTAEAALQAFTRQQIDPDLDQKVIDTIEVDGGKAIDVPLLYETLVPSTIFPALPTTGSLKKGEIYSYSNGAVMVVQDHDRTIYTPEETPALFSFYRPNPEGKEWIAGEQVALNSTRTYGGKTYKCIQAHQTQDGWKPDSTPALWQEVIVTPDIPVWVQPTGAHDAYKIGDIVHYPDAEGQLWRSKINANTTKPDGDIPFNRYWEPYK